LGRIIEPGASSSSERFNAIKTLADAGIYCGVLLMPVLPFLNDTAENIISIIEMAKKAGAKYIIGWMGMTLRDKQRDYYYEKLDKHCPGVKSNYLARYGNQYSITVPDGIKLHSLFNATCKEFGIATAMKFFEENKPVQLDLFG
jgi:DNA repair photolyase